MRRASLLVAALTAVLSIGCRDEQILKPTAAGGPSALIMDGATNGNADFFFLPPLVPDPSGGANFDAGKFNGNLAPVVEVCELTGDPRQGAADCAGSTPVFGPANMRLDLAKQRYQVNWDTKASALVSTKFYRIRARGSPRGSILGFLDVDPVDQGLKNVKTGDVVQFQDGRTLPINVRIEEGAFGARNPDHVERVVPSSIATGSVDVTTNTGFAGARFFDGWLPEGISQVTVIIERVPVTNATTPTSCLESGLLEIEGCYRFRTDPDLHGLGPNGTDLTFRVPVIAGVCVEIPELLHTGAPFQLHRRQEQDVEGKLSPTGPTVALPSVEAPFLTCGEFRPTHSLLGAIRSGRLSDLANAAWQAIARGVGRLVTPSPLHAFDLGAGGSTDGFSRFGWARAATMVKAAPTDNQVGLMGGKLLVDPSVCLVTMHPPRGLGQPPRPLVGEQVTFTVTAGGGTIGGGGSMVVNTGEDGCASASWVLGSATGLRGNTLTAAARATPNSVEFSAAGLGLVVDAGARHSCALNVAGAAFCWGFNDSGRVGDGTRTDRLVPTPVAAGLRFATVSAGFYHTCGVTTSGAAYCWGGNIGGALGDGTPTTRLVPTPVAGGLTFAALSAGSYHTCGLTTSGAAYCWGGNIGGALGDGTTSDRLVPTAVVGGLTFAKLSAGYFQTCGVTTSGAAYCWGINPVGQLGDGTQTNRLVPTPVAGGLTFADVSGQVYHTCGVTMSGAAYCWGSNSNGQLGDNTTTQRLVPTAVAGGLTFTSISAGDVHNCGVVTNGAAYCWGLNGSGQIGDGTRTDRLVPTRVAGGLTFAALTGGDFHSCGVTTSGAAYCWGLNEVGQVGDGTTINRLVPTAVVFQSTLPTTVPIAVNNFEIDLRSGRVENPSGVTGGGFYKGTQVVFGAGFAYDSVDYNTLVGYNPRGTESDFVASPVTVLSGAPEHHTTTQLQPRAGLIALRDVTVTQESFAFTSAGDQDYVLLKYTFTNSGQFASIVHAGFVVDVELLYSESPVDDIATFNPTLGIAEATEEDTESFPQVFGIVPIATFETQRNYAAWTNGGNPGDPATSAGYFPLLSGGLQGPNSVGPADVRQLIGFGPFSIPAGGSRVVWFALVGGDNRTAFNDHVAAGTAKVKELEGR